MYCDEINTIAALLFNDGKDIVSRHLDDGTVLFNSFNGSLIDGHRADSHRTGGYNRPPNRRNIAAGTQIHDRISASINGDVQLFQLGIDIAVVGGGTDIGIDLGSQPLPDTTGCEIGVPDIGGNDDCAAGHTLPDEFGLHPLSLGHRLHLRGDSPFPSQFQLCHRHLHKRKPRADGG